jgi:hypothetical protein
LLYQTMDCKVNVDYEPLEDDPVRVETYVGVEE